MNKSRQIPVEIPDVILLLGTDASGKDHVANILEKMIHESGGHVQKRRRYFSGKRSRTKDSTKKSLLDYAQERFFLFVYTYLGFLVPPLMAAITLVDILMFRPPPYKLLVVGHNAIRALGFCHLGKDRHSHGIELPFYLRAVFRLMIHRTRAHIIVLDVDKEIRRQRLEKRSAEGTLDNIDKFMYKNSARSEWIERNLVHLVCDHLGGVLLRNNDLPDEEIRQKLAAGFAGHDNERRILLKCPPQF